MNVRTILKALLGAAALTIAVLVQGCAMTDGGIVGTGNQPECEAAAKGGAVREDCKR